MEGDINRFFKSDKFGEYVGIELLEVSAGSAKVKLELKDQHLNALKTAHGGAIFTLADLAFALASNSHGTIATAINASISYTKAATAGTTLIAEAKEVAVNPKLGNYTIHVTNEQGDIIAIFQGLAYRKKQKLSTVM